MIGLFFNGEFGMTKVLLEEAAESGVVVLEAMGVYDVGATGTGGGKACGGRRVIEDVPEGPPKSEGKESAPGVDGCAMAVSLVVFLYWFESDGKYR